MTGSRPPKAALLVAQRVIRDVVRGGMRPGDLLPPERVMLETYETGRGTLREALRLLEFQGVIALKPGPGGGPILLNPDPSHLASTLQLLMQLNRATYRYRHGTDDQPARRGADQRRVAGRTAADGRADA
jgi:GntR family transcriptional repressor for pyruvate dehydrogenase complex